MSETQVLMTVLNFFWFSSWNHFLEKSFNFQWGGFIFKWEVCPMGGISFDGALQIKSWDGGSVPSHYGKLWPCNALTTVISKVPSSTQGIFYRNSVTWCDSFCSENPQNVPLRIYIINAYNCLLKNTNFLIKTSNEQVTSNIIRWPIYFCFGWHNLFFCTIWQ